MIAFGSLHWGPTIHEIYQMKAELKVFFSGEGFGGFPVEVAEQTPQ